jgi:hypothetical protein
VPLAGPPTRQAAGAARLPPSPHAVPLAQPALPRTPRAASPAGAALLPPRLPAAAAPLMVTRWSQKSPGLKILWIWTLGTAASNRIRHFFLPFLLFRLSNRANSRQCQLMIC